MSIDTKRSKAVQFANPKMFFDFNMVIATTF